MKRSTLNGPIEFKVPFTDDTGIEDFETVTAKQSTIGRWDISLLKSMELYIGGFNIDAVNCVRKKLDIPTIN